MYTSDSLALTFRRQEMEGKWTQMLMLENFKPFTHIVRAHFVTFSEEKDLLNMTSISQVLRKNITLFPCRITNQLGERQHVSLTVLKNYMV